MEKCTSTQYDQIVLICLMVAIGGVSYVTPKPEENSFSNTQDHKALQSQFCLKDRFKRVLSLRLGHQDRQKRFIHFRFKLPHESEFQLKWAILLRVPAEEKYETDCAVEIEWLRELPPYLTDAEYEPPFSTLFGSTGATAEDHNEMEPEEYNDLEVEDRKAKFPERKRRKKKQRKRKKKKSRRTKRSLHVTDRLGAYEVIEESFSKVGLPARACLLRTVCEVAEAPLHYGLLGDFLNLLLTPSAASLSAPSGEVEELREHIAAEVAGRERGDCDRHFSDCPASVFDLVPLIKHKILDVKPSPA